MITRMLYLALLGLAWQVLMSVFVYAASVTLTWDAGIVQEGQSQPDGYVLYRDNVEIARVLAPPYTDTPPDLGPYVYTVKAYSLGALSLASNAVTVDLALLPVALAVSFQCDYTPAATPQPAMLVCQERAAQPAVPPGPYALRPVGSVTVSQVDSEETVAQDNRGSNAIDGKLDTFWHTQWQQAAPPLPHSITLDLGQGTWTDGLRYTPRQDGILNGTITQYRLETSLDGQAWQVQVPSGAWTGDATVKETRWPAIQARYIRLTALASWNGFPYASAAEIGVYAVP